MATCDLCGNDYDKTFQVILGGQTYTFDSFECAIHMLAPTCAHCGVRIVGHRNMPSRLAADASALYARNLYNFLSAFWDGEAKRLALPDDDEIVKGVRLTRGGEVVSERLKG